MTNKKAAHPLQTAYYSIFLILSFNTPNLTRLLTQCLDSYGMDMVAV
jgi:hypothetical protein